MSSVYFLFSLFILQIVYLFITDIFITMYIILYYNQYGVHCIAVIALYYNLASCIEMLFIQSRKSRWISLTVMGTLEFISGRRKMGNRGRSKLRAPRCVLIDPRGFKFLIWTRPPIIPVSSTVNQFRCRAICGREYFASRNRFLENIVDFQRVMQTPSFIPIFSARLSRIVCRSD